ncbi:conserved hypothetical membrane protein [Desulfotalea psychrophila LSv54]|uniref:Conserved hypothetical membrane protein n=1 Tax=Desulfotalea psychrophila (strain LSv54 / DSM 12343) TaxID=177439 RepID=Q6AS02_DESPS|nr:conserved hypothetical membrane protein [Desulfotalea psychrophila LSv54]
MVLGVEGDSLVEEKIGQDSKDRVKAARVSLVASFFIMCCKFAAFIVSDSQAIFSDAAESTVNVVAALLALIIITMAMKPADDRHPYGHGKMEFFSAAFEGGLITFAALAILVKAVNALFYGQEIKELGYGLLLIGFAGLLNLFLGLYLKRAGKASRSKALLASSAHVLSDLWTSVGVIAGLLLYLLTGWAWVDPAIAIVVALFLTYTGFSIVRDSFSDLLDTRDEELISHLAELVKRDRFPGIVQVHHARILRSGAFHHIDAHLVVPEYWDISEVHIQSEIFTKRLMADYDYRGEICFHLDPCRRAYCVSCDYLDCIIRKGDYQCCNVLLLDEFLSPEEPGNVME